MRKIEIALVIVILLLVAFIIGCEPQKEVKVLPREKLIKTPDYWSKVFGDDNESNLYFNVWLSEQAIREMKNKMSELEKRVKAVEDPNST